MIDQRTLCAIHRLAPDGLAVRTIATTLGLSRQTTSPYLDDPNPPRPRRPRPRQLDPCQDALARLREIAPKGSAADRRQRLHERGCKGGIPLVRADWHGVRGASKKPQPVLRCASAPGGQGQTDWGHCGSIASGDTQRQRSCLAVIAGQSRRRSLECTHAQRQETLHRCLRHAGHLFQGTPKARVHDHLRTAVLERQGPRVRCNAHVVAFLRPLQIPPRACHVAQPQAKGQVDKGAIPSSRHTCWPLRTCRALTALQAQANQWRDEVAKVSVHATTGQQPPQRCEPPAMRP